jgi:hypothetical protein
MGKVLRAFLVAVLIGFVVIQLVPYGGDHQNPPVTAEPAWDSAETRGLAVTTCFDCHSNETEWPWYSWVAPVSWLVQRDVDEGREELNFSQWGSGQESDDVAESVEEGEMPPFSYLVTHPDARLADADRAALIEGLRATFGGD